MIQGIEGWLAPFNSLESVAFQSRAESDTTRSLNKKLADLDTEFDAVVRWGRIIPSLKDFTFPISTLPSSLSSFPKLTLTLSVTMTGWVRIPNVHPVLFLPAFFLVKPGGHRLHVQGLWFAKALADGQFPNLPAADELTASAKDLLNHYSCELDDDEGSDEEDEDPDEEGEVVEGEEEEEGEDEDDDGGVS